MENIVALGIVIPGILSLKQTDKPFAKNAGCIRKGCMVKISKIGSRFHMAVYNNKIVYVKATGVDLILKNPYSHTDFLNDLGKILHFQEPKFMLESTVTLSVCRNTSHRLITPVERYLKTLGYYQGRIEEEDGEAPLFGPLLESAVKDYQAFYLHLPAMKQDGCLKACELTWKSLIESTLH